MSNVLSSKTVSERFSSRLSQKAVNQLRSWIIEQGLSSGEWLPAERVLAEQLNLSRETLRRALAQLRNDNILELRGRRGHRLCTDNRPQQNKQSGKQLRRLGVTVWGSADFVQNPSISQTIQGINDACIDRHAVVEALIVPAQRNLENSWDDLLDLQSQRRDGLISTGVYFPPATLAHIAALGYPAVFINQCGLLPDISEDLAGATALLVQHLAELGHRHIGFITGPGGYHVQQGIDTFYREIAKLGESPDPTLIYRTDYQESEGRTRTHELLGHPRCPTAILAGDTYLALAAIATIKEAGLRVPDDISVASISDFFPHSPISVSVPQITATRLPHYKVGKRAGEVLLNWLDNGTPQFIREIIAVELIVRDTTAPCRKK